jgi:hypothetical protein
MQRSFVQNTEDSSHPVVFANLEDAIEGAFGEIRRLSICDPPFSVSVETTPQTPANAVRLTAFERRA